MLELVSYNHVIDYTITINYTCSDYNKITFYLYIYGLEIEILNIC